MKSFRFSAFSAFTDSLTQSSLREKVSIMGRFPRVFSLPYWKLTRKSLVACRDGGRGINCILPLSRPSAMASQQIAEAITRVRQQHIASSIYGRDGWINLSKK